MTTSCVWYRAALRNAVVRAWHVRVIRKYFVDALGAAGWPDGACLFLSNRRRPRSKGLDEAAAEAVFFSPAAIAAVPHLIVVFGAEPSPPPSRTTATLLVGMDADWKLLPCLSH